VSISGYIQIAGFIILSLCHRLKPNESIVLSFSNNTQDDKKSGRTPTEKFGELSTKENAEHRS
jgi:hypothetical protein